MADQTLTDAFSTLRTRLVQMGFDALADLSMHSLDYADDSGRGGNYPYWEVVIPRLTLERQTQGANRQRIPLQIEQRYWAGLVTESYEGDLQERVYWNYLPTALQYFEEHRALRYTGVTTGIPFLQDTNSGITGVEVRTPEVEGGYALVLVFTWSITRDTSFVVKC